MRIDKSVKTTVSATAGYLHWVHTTAKHIKPFGTRGLYFYSRFIYPFSKYIWSCNTNRISYILSLARSSRRLQSICFAIPPKINTVVSDRQHHEETCTVYCCQLCGMQHACISCLFLFVTTNDIWVKAIDMRHGITAATYNNPKHFIQRLANQLVHSAKQNPIGN